MSFDGLAPPVDSRTITNDGFYPDVVLASFYQQYDVPAELNQDLVHLEVIAAVVKVNRILAGHRVDCWADKSSLAESSNQVLDGSSVAELWYLEAVFSLAKSNLLVSKQTSGMRDNLSALSADVAQMQGYWQNRFQMAIRELMTTQDKPQQKGSWLAELI